MPAIRGGRMTAVKEGEKKTSRRVIATFRTADPAVLADGDRVLVEQQGEEAVARRVPRIDSDEPIGSFAELADALEAERRRR